MKIMQPAIAAMLCAGACAVGGCGGSSPSSSSSSAAASRSSGPPQVGQWTPGFKSESATTSGGRDEHASAVSGQRSGRTETGSSGRERSGADDPVESVQLPPGASISEQQASFANGASVNPCSLVSLSQARALAGTAIAGRFEAPLGPTCVYKLSHSKSEITLTVQSLPSSQLIHAMKNPASLSVAGHRAYCGGSRNLILPLRRGQVLSVSAPCAIAARFATVAVKHLAA